MRVRWITVRLAIIRRRPTLRVGWRDLEPLTVSERGIVALEQSPSTTFSWPSGAFDLLKRLRRNNVRHRFRLHRGCMTAL
jgi:hypothetical protein